MPSFQSDSITSLTPSLHSDSNTSLALTLTQSLHWPHYFTPTQTLHWPHHFTLAQSLHWPHHFTLTQSLHWSHHFTFDSNHITFTPSLKLLTLTAPLSLVPPLHSDLDTSLSFFLFLTASNVLTLVMYANAAWCQTSERGGQNATDKLWHLTVHLPCLLSIMKFAAYL